MLDSIKIIAFYKDTNQSVYCTLCCIFGPIYLAESSIYYYSALFSDQSFFFILTPIISHPLNVFHLFFFVS